MNEAIRSLDKVKDYIPNKAYNTAMARIFATHYINLMNSKNKYFTRSDVEFRVNMLLASRHLEPVSYNIFRDLC